VSKPPLLNLFDGTKKIIFTIPFYLACHFYHHHASSNAPRCCCRCARLPPPRHEQHVVGRDVRYNADDYYWQQGSHFNCNMLIHSV